MAFDRDDTDTWFDQLLKPILDESSLAAIRIDRVEHNDNIDARIIAEIEKADIVIADLTYARPSVYFEAGYAQRSVPVIYTCRKDHLQPPNSETPEYQRVHFDLAMKNIIAWQSPSDATFRERLTKRIDLLTRPIRANNEKALEKRELEERFKALPVDGQLLGGVAAVRDVFKKHKVQIAEYAERRAHTVEISDDYLVIGQRKGVSEIFGCQARVTPSMNLTTLKALKKLLVAPLYDIKLNRPKQLEVLRDLLLLVTTGPVPLERLRTVFSEFSLVSAERKHLEWSGGAKLPAKRITSVDHILIQRSSYRAPFVGLITKDESPDVEVDIWPEGQEYRNRAGRSMITTKLLTVNRVINVVAIDRAKSITDVQERVEAALIASDPTGSGSELSG